MPPSLRGSPGYATARRRWQGDGHARLAGDGQRRRRSAPAMRATSRMKDALAAMRTKASPL